MPAPAGVPVVLTADRTLMAGYDLLLDGMFAASQTTSAPGWLMNSLLLPRPPHPGGRSLVAPLGLRRVEAALVRGGMPPQDMAVVDDAHLAAVVGPRTRVIAVSSGEPTGLGMNSSTMAGVVGGKIYPQAMFEGLLAEIRRCLHKTESPAQVVLGGPGAWQLAGAREARQSLGVDHVVTGYVEGNVGDIFAELRAGHQLPDVIVGQPVAPEAIPPIRGASTMGVVEISRGCGLGCDFCTIARVPMAHLPLATILADARTNLAAGLTSLAVLSEDFFRYGGQGMKCQPSAVIDLLEQLRALAGLRLIQVDHCNATSIAHFNDSELARLHQLLAGVEGQGYVWVNVGVETAAGDLLQSCSGRPKMAGVAAEDWGAFTAEQLRRLCRAGFMPMASLLIGLPGENEKHVQQTLAWVRSLSDQKLTIFPVLYAPLDGSAPPTRETLSPLNWQLIRECYRLNFRWMPVMYWDNQRLAGVSRGRRLLFQMLGHGQVAQWTWLLSRHQARATARQAREG